MRNRSKLSRWVYLSKYTWSMGHRAQERQRQFANWLFKLSKREKKCWLVRLPISQWTILYRTWARRSNAFVLAILLESLTLSSNIALIHWSPSKRTFGRMKWKNFRQPENDYQNARQEIKRKNCILKSSISKTRFTCFRSRSFHKF